MSTQQLGPICATNHWHLFGPFGQRLAQMRAELENKIKFLTTTHWRS
jgi:hypothetical protein